MKRLISVLVVALALFAQQKAEPARIAGSWKMSMETPHGTVEGPLQVQQDGSKLTGTYEVEHFGLMPLSGTVEGNKVSLKIEVQGGQVTIGITGTVDGGKMTGTTELGGNWSANRETASR